MRLVRILAEEERAARNGPARDLVRLGEGTTRDRSFFIPAAEPGTIDLWHPVFYDGQGVCTVWAEQSLAVRGIGSAQDIRKLKQDDPVHGDGCQAIDRGGS